MSCRVDPVNEFIDSKGPLKVSKDKQLTNYFT